MLPTPFRKAAHRERFGRVPGAGRRESRRLTASVQAGYRGGAVGGGRCSAGSLPTRRVRGATRRRIGAEAAVEGIGPAAVPVAGAGDFVPAVVFDRIDHRVESLLVLDEDPRRTERIPDPEHVRRTGGAAPGLDPRNASSPSNRLPFRMRPTVRSRPPEPVRAPTAEASGGMAGPREGSRLDPVRRWPGLPGGAQYARSKQARPAPSEHRSRSATRPSGPRQFWVWVHQK